MKIGIIGGSGLYNLEGIGNVEEREIRTPFGAPSDSYTCGHLGGKEVFFLPRHGRGHRILPSEINHRANIFGFKELGVETVLSVSAVGSLKEEIHPRDIVLPDQYFDRTKRPGSAQTFFGSGVVAHVSFGHPGCTVLREAVADAVAPLLARASDRRRQLFTTGTYVNMEGPAFSTRAESYVYRRMGFDVIGMTSLPEAKLCREAEMCYQAIAMVTDYDCWHESEEPVTVEMVVGHLTANTEFAKGLLARLIPQLPEASDCDCRSALQHAILSDPATVPDETKDALAPIIGKYV